MARESQPTAHTSMVCTTPAAGRPPALPQTLDKPAVMGTSLPGALGKGSVLALGSSLPLISYVTFPRLQARVIKT